MTRIYFTDQYILPLPPAHRFPMSKYRLLHERVLAADLVPREDLIIPHAATDQELLRAHDMDYVYRVQHGELTAKELRRIGFPWSLDMVERSRRSSGATIEACISAFQEGYAVNLAGGTHHSFRDHGEGYCVFNDSAIAARAVQACGLASRIAVIDLDVHQGNGTAAIVRDDPTIFTFSMHGVRNYPFHKEISDLDIELEDGTTDAAYLEALDRGIQILFSRFDPELVIYLAGADPHEGDTLGRLKLTKAGLSARDSFVFDACDARGLPIAITMAGGYGKDINDTVDVHFQTVTAAVRRGVIRKVKAAATTANAAAEKNTSV